MVAAGKRRSNLICKGKFLKKKPTHIFDIWFMLNHLFNAAHLKLYSIWKSNQLIAPLLRLVLSKIQFFWNFRWLNRIGIPYVVAIIPFSSNFGTYFPWWFLVVQNFWLLALVSVKKWVWNLDLDIYLMKITSVSLTSFDREPRTICRPTDAALFTVPTTRSANRRFESWKRFFALLLDADAICGKQCC